MNQQLQRIESIDVLRGWAILGVIGTHTFLGAFRPWKFEYTVHLFGHDVSIYPTIFANGWLGVNLFFVISGFVLALPFVLSPDKPVSFIRFYKSRAARLLPLFYVIITFLFLFKYPNFTNAISDFMGWLFFYFTFQPETWMPRKLAVLWSLGLEIWFSIALPVIVIAARKLSIEKIAIFSIIFCFIFRAVADEMFIANTEVEELYSGQRYLMVINPYKDYIFGRFDDFVLGMVAAQYYANGKYRLFAKPLSFFGGIALMSLSSYIWNMSVIEPGMSYYKSAATTLFSVGSCLLILNVLSKDWSGKFTFLRYIGLRCYSIYLIHALLLQHSLFRGAFKNLSVYDIEYWAVFSAYFVVTLLLSEVTYRMIELRGKDWSKNFLDSLEHKSRKFISSR